MYDLSPSIKPSPDLSSPEARRQHARPGPHDACRRRRDTMHRHGVVQRLWWWGGRRASYGYAGNGGKEEKGDRLHLRWNATGEGPAGPEGVKKGGAA
jgi:hypothetical protein